jgi:recombination protein RecT
MPEQSLAKAPQKVGLREYIRSDEIQLRFADIVGRQNVGSYISSVMIAVANSEALQKCEMKSIVSSALRAATLKLEVDPGIGYAYLVPYGSQANLIIGYKGLHQMAVRTGKYRYINVEEVWEGETATTERFTGVVTITGTPKNKEKAIGIVAYFELLKGYKKFLYMTMEEIEAHAKKFSKSYGMDSKNNVWKTNRRSMEKKTVLRLLLTRWADLSGVSVANLDSDEDFSEDLPEPADAQPAKKMTKRDVDKAISDMGFETGPAIEGQYEEETLPDPETVTPPPETVYKPEATHHETTDAPAETKRPPRPYEPAYLKKAISEMAGQYKAKGEHATDKDKSSLAGEMRSLFAGMSNDEELAKKVLTYLVGVNSASLMEETEILAVRFWLGITHDSGGDLIPNVNSITEAAKIISFLNK